MFIICILFSNLTTKAYYRVYVKGHQINQIIPRRNRAPRFKIPGSATGDCNRLKQVNCEAQMTNLSLVRVHDI